MSVIQALDTPATVLQRQPTNGDASVRPDFQFWHEVFDQAHGQGLGSAAQGQSSETSVEDAAPDQTMGHDGSTVPEPSTAESRAPGAATAATLNVLAHDSLLNALSVHAGMSLSMAAGAAQFCSQRDGDAFASRGQSEATEDAQTSVQVAAQPESQSEQQVDAGLRAHVMATPDRQLKVALRAQRGLSVSQALAAAAQAMDHAGASGGDVAQVVLNGACIYQQAVHGEQPKGATTAPRFELKC